MSNEQKISTTDLELINQYIDDPMNEEVALLVTHKIELNPDFALAFNTLTQLNKSLSTGLSAKNFEINKAVNNARKNFELKQKIKNITIIATSAIVILLSVFIGLKLTESPKPLPKLPNEHKLPLKPKPRPAKKDTVKIDSVPPVEIKIPKKKPKENPKVVEPEESLIELTKTGGFYQVDEGKMEFVFRNDSILLLGNFDVPNGKVYTTEAPTRFYLRYKGLYYEVWPTPDPAEPRLVRDLGTIERIEQTKPNKRKFKVIPPLKTSDLYKVGKFNYTMQIKKSTQGKSVYSFDTKDKEPKLILSIVDKNVELSLIYSVKLNSYFITDGIKLYRLKENVTNEPMVPVQNQELIYTLTRRGLMELQDWRDPNSNPIHSQQTDENHY